MGYALIKSNLVRLYEAINENKNVSYYTETTLDQERILDIFVRANSGGKSLGKSELMMSTIVTSWKGDNPRQRINTLIKDLNEYIKPVSGENAGKKISVDWVMKACLVACELDCVYKISNFNRKNMEKIQSSWEEIERTLKDTMAIVKSFGIDSRTLTSLNALMPIVAFIHYEKIKNGISIKFNIRNEASVKNMPIMKRWLLKALVSRTFGGSSDGTIKASLEIIKVAVEKTGEFPEKELMSRLRGDSKFDLTTESGVRELLETSYKQREFCFQMLSLLYPDSYISSDDYEMDHIFPQSYFKKAKYNNFNIGEKFRSEYDEMRDSIANLCLISSDDNRRRGAMDINAWLAQKDESYKRFHFIPQQMGHLDFTQFLTFIKERKELLRERLTNVLLP